MILHVARAFDIGRIGAAALEFVEQLAIGLAHHIDQHVQAAAMGHAQHDLLHAELAAALDDLFQRRDGGFAAVQAEALGADEAVGRRISRSLRASISLLRIAFLPSGVKTISLSGPSMRRCSQSFCSASLMCMNS